MDYLKSLVSSDSQESKVVPTRTETPSQRRRRLEAELEASKNPTSFADTLTTYATTAYQTVSVGAGYVAENAGSLVKNAQEYFNPDGSVNENSDEARRRAKQEGEYGGYVRVRKDQKYAQGDPRYPQGRRPDNGQRQPMNDGRYRQRPVDDKYSQRVQHRPDGRQQRPPDDRMRQQRPPQQQRQMDRSPPRIQRPPQRMDSAPRPMHDRQIDPPRQQRSPRRSNEPPRGYRPDPRYEQDNGSGGRWAHPPRGY